MTKARVLVTSGTGFIAAYVVRDLLDAGFTVRTTVRDPSNNKKNEYLNGLVQQGKPLEIVKGDLHDPLEVWVKITQGCEYVQHVASPYYFANKTVDELVEPAVEGTTVVLKAAAQTGVKHVVLTSSVAAVAYGDFARIRETPTRPMTEADWSADETFTTASTAYFKSKTLAEKVAWRIWEENKGTPHQFKLSTICPGQVIGTPLCANDATSVELISAVLSGKQPASPHINFGVVDVRDVAKAHVAAMTRPNTDGQRYILVADTYPLSNTARIIADNFNKYGFKVSARTVPWLLVKLLGLFDRQMASFSLLVNEPMKFDNGKSIEQLGINYIPAEKMVVDACNGILKLGIVTPTPEYKQQFGLA